MFAYILRTHASPSEQSDAFFRRFKATPGLLHAYDLQGVDDPEDSVVVTIWDRRQSAEAYLNDSPLRKEVDRTMSVTRTLYEVRDSK